MLNSKKGLKLAVLSVATLLGLTACSSSDEIFSKPSTYDDPIIQIDGATEEIHNNVLSVIYDLMHEGSITGKTLDAVLFQYASSVFGYYNKESAPEGQTEVTLKEAYIDLLTNGGNLKVTEFIKKHKAYWYYNENGEHVKEDGVTVIAEGEDWEPGATEFAHVRAKWEAIEARIAKNMYNRISSGSYTEKNYYFEKDFLRSLHENGEKVVNYLTLPAATWEKFIIPYTVEGEDIFDKFTGYDNNEHIAIHRAYYQSSVVTDPINPADLDENAPKATYIEDVVIPEVYNDLLIEQYLLDEDVAAVRNSRARKINVIKIEKYSTFTNNADMLVRDLIDQIYKTPDNTVETLEVDRDTIEEHGEELFNKYSVVAKGLYDQIDGNAELEEIVGRLQGFASDIYQVETKQGISYYKNTTYGDLVEDYDKVMSVNSWELLDSSKYSTFTSNGTRTVKEGLEQQKIDIMQAQNVTKGWYIQSSSPSLDSNGTINDRLFKLSVANAKIELDKNEDEHFADHYQELVDTDRLVRENGVWSVRDGAAEGENKFLCSINGAYYLKFDGRPADGDWKNDILYDDGNAYYIVQVFEAAKDSKLRNASKTNYATTRGQVFMDEVIDEVAKIVGETGNYATLSKEHWIEKMSLEFHDQKIYDYFKSNYPDIFED